MLVLPNMDPALHPRSTSLPRTYLLRIIRATSKLSILLLKILATAMAMLLLPRMIQLGVQCLDNVYELIGRRARSPWDTQSLWGNGVMVGLAVLFVLHDLLRRISYPVILSEDAGEGQARRGPDGPMRHESNVTWEKLLMRILVPVLIYAGLFYIIWQVSILRTGSKEVVKANTVNLADDVNTRLVWRDR